MASWAPTALLRRAVSGASLVVNVAATVGSTALLVEPIRVGRTLSEFGAQVEPLVRAAAGVTLEAVGAEPAGDAVPTDSGPGSRSEGCATGTARPWQPPWSTHCARLPASSRRSSTGESSAWWWPSNLDGPAASRLCKIVADAERSLGVAGRRTPAAPLPGDDTVLVGRMAAATAALRA